MGVRRDDDSLLRAGAVEDHDHDRRRVLLIRNRLVDTVVMLTMAQWAVQNGEEDSRALLTGGARQRPAGDERAARARAPHPARAHPGGLSIMGVDDAEKVSDEFRVAPASVVVSHRKRPLEEDVCQSQARQFW
jgi:hypothetical protein